MASRILKQQTLQKVIHDLTLQGEGTQQSPLGVIGAPNASITLAMLAAEVYQTAVVELGGDFTAGEEVKCVRVGDLVVVTATSLLTHSSSNTANSAAGVIPAAFRPTNSISNNYYASPFFRVVVTDSGQFQLRYWDSDGSNTNRTDSAAPPTVIYNIT